MPSRLVSVDRAVAIIKLYRFENLAVAVVRNYAKRKTSGRGERERKRGYIVNSI